MKKALILITLFIGLLTSCDKIEKPYKTVIEIDTTLYTAGNWGDYPWPTFDQNNNTIKNILLEDYTGHKCTACPGAAATAKALEDANPDRLFTVAIHAGTGGDNSFQVTSSDCGNSVTNPDNKFCRDFTTPEGDEYGFTYANGYGFSGNPSGNFNRKAYGAANMFISNAGWNPIFNLVTADPEFKVNLQAKSNYYQDVNGGYLHVEADFIEAYSKNVNMVVYLIEKEVIDWQDSTGVQIQFYHHHNVFLGCIDGLAFGKSIGTSFEAGDKVYTDYHFTLPEGQMKEEFHYLIYVSDAETGEVLQIIKHEL